MILSDKTIRNLVDAGTLGIYPFDKDRLQPASYDVKLGGSIKTFRSGVLPFINTNNLEIERVIKELVFVDNDSMVIYPNEFLLANTIEYVRIPKHIVGVLNGKSSLARLGLLVHLTAGYLDPGFEGTITLEIVNMNKTPIRLYKNMLIAQIVFQFLDRPCERPYGSKGLDSKYQGQIEATESRYGTIATDSKNANGD